MNYATIGNVSHVVSEDPNDAHGFNPSLGVFPQFATACGIRMHAESAPKTTAKPSASLCETCESTLSPTPLPEAAE